MKASLAVGLLLAPTLGWATLGAEPSNHGPARTAPLARAATVSASSQPYRVVRTTLPSQTVLTEFVDGAGLVFAVSWSGRFQPDLKELLGVHFQRLGAAQVATRTQLRLQTPDVRIEASGRMGAFRGRAWIPAQVPVGFDPRDIL